MTRGRLRCCGSSLWLKSRFGVGYNLTLCLGSGSSEGGLVEAAAVEAAGEAAGEKNAGAEEEEKVQEVEVDLGAEAASLVQVRGGEGGGASARATPEHPSGRPFQDTCAHHPTSCASLLQADESGERAEAIRALVMGEVPSAEQVSHAARETAFRIPRAAAADFPRLLRKISDSKARLGITAFGVSVTTLEEVFIRIADEEVSLEAHRRQEALVDDEGLLHDEEDEVSQGGAVVRASTS